jgi:hypothetical protein
VTLIHFLKVKFYIVAALAGTDQLLNDGNACEVAVYINVKFM